MMASPILLPSPHHPTPSAPAPHSVGAFPILYPSQMSFLSSFAQRTRSRGPIPPPLKIPAALLPSRFEHSPARSPIRSPNPSHKASLQPSPASSPARTKDGGSPSRFGGVFRRDIADDEQEIRPELHSENGLAVPNVTRKLQKRQPSSSESRDPGHSSRSEQVKETEEKRKEEKRRPIPLTPYYRGFEKLPFDQDNSPSPSPIAMPIPKRHISSRGWSTESLRRTSSHTHSTSIILEVSPIPTHPTPLKRSRTTTPRPLTPSLRRPDGASPPSRPGRKRARSVSFLLPVEQLQPDDNILPLPRSQTPHPKRNHTSAQPTRSHSDTPQKIDGVDYFSISPTTLSPSAFDPDQKGRQHHSQAIDDALHHRPRYLQYQPRDEGKCTIVASTRKGFFNRRGDQLVDNNGKRMISNDPYPLDLASYPRWAWQDEKGRCIEYSTHKFIEYGSTRWKEVMGLD